MIALNSQGFLDVLLVSAVEVIQDFCPKLFGAIQVFPLLPGNASIQRQDWGSFLEWQNGTKNIKQATIHHPYHSKEIHRSKHMFFSLKTHSLPLSPHYLPPGDPLRRCREQCPDTLKACSDANSHEFSPKNLNSTDISSGYVKNCETFLSNVCVCVCHIFVILVFDVDVDVVISFSALGLR